MAVVVAHALDTQIIKPDDTRWAKNRIIEAIGASSLDAAACQTPDAPVGINGFHEALDVLAGVLIKTFSERRAQGGWGAAGGTPTPDMAAAKIMGAIMPRPSEVCARFDALLAKSPQAATSYLHGLSVNCDYVKARQMAGNPRWRTETRWGALEITINLAKPEKDPRDIARAAQAEQHDAYPLCQLCMENEGYAGRTGADGQGAWPARQNLRIARLALDGFGMDESATSRQWGLQYSPYSYFEEHCIALSQQHRPMRIDRACLARLVQLVDMLPHYFFGSNADLPIVGGSILSHDHFQGGRHVFAMQQAAHGPAFCLRGLPDVAACTITWPVSVIRLAAHDPVRLVEAASLVASVWADHADPQAGIVPWSKTPAGPVRHNTVTPIARKRGEVFQLDLALRCNITSRQHPLGVFHPHQQLHHIKKENIGLIEVMGMAILPARLKPQLEAVERHLVEGTSLDDDPLCQMHADWALDIARRHPHLDAHNIRDIVRDEVGQVFARVLEDAGVFKHTPQGRLAQERFISKLT